MPTLFRHEGLSFDIYCPDHVPPHIHVWDGVEQAVITISGQTVLYPTKIKGKRLKMAKQVIKDNQDYFTSQWNLRN